MKKVLIISATDIIGGAEIVLYDFLKNNRVHEFYILTSEVVEVVNFYNTLPNVKVFSSSLLNNYKLKGNIGSWIKILKVLFFIKKLCKKYNINVLYGNNSKDFIILSMFNKFITKEIFTISHIHDMLKKKIHRIYFELFARNINLFIVPSKACAELLGEYKINRKNIIQVYNGIEINKFLNKDCKNFKNLEFYFIGNINLNKRVDLFIDIINKISNISNKLVKGYIIGDIIDYSYFKNIEDKIHNLDNKCYIEYIGKTEHDILLNKIFPKIKFLVLTSNSDTLPTVIIEGMASGCIVFARDVDGVNEIIDDGYDGFLFDYNDSVENIAKKILLCIDQEEKLHAVSLNAINKIKEKFNSDKKRYIINELIEKCEENNCDM